MNRKKDHLIVQVWILNKLYVSHNQISMPPPNYLILATTAYQEKIYMQNGWFALLFLFVFSKREGLSCLKQSAINRESLSCRYALSVQSEIWLWCFQISLEKEPQINRKSYNVNLVGGKWVNRLDLKCLLYKCKPHFQTNTAINNPCLRWERDRLSESRQSKCVWSFFSAENSPLIWSQRFSLASGAAW